MAAEPASQTAITLAVGTVAVTGTLLGMHYDSLLFGLFGSLIMLSRSEKVSRLVALGNVGTSMLVAGVGSPILAAIGVAHFEVLRALGDELPRHASSLLLGAGWQVGIPTAWAWVKNRLGV